MTLQSLRQLAIPIVQVPLELPFPSEMFVSLWGVDHLYDVRDVHSNSESDCRLR